MKRIVMRVPWPLFSIAVLGLAGELLSAEARHIYGPLPGDAMRVETPAPPADVFERAGYTVKVKESAWDNRPLAVSRFPCPWPGLNNAWVQRFRRRYDFLDHIEKGKNEVERVLLLRQWVHRKIAQGEGDLPELDPFVILDTAGQGAGYVCTQFSIVLQACAISAGWVAWNVHVDLDHSATERSAHHAVTEVWINELGKWAVFDPLRDCHYEKNGVMLSSVELAREWVSNEAKDVDVLVGVERKKVGGTRQAFLGGRHDAAGYFWNKRVWSWDPFRTFGSVQPDMQVSYVWDAHQGKEWYQGRVPEVLVIHAFGRGALHFTSREADVCPDIGTCRLDLTSHAPGLVKVNVATFTPGLEALLVRFDGGPWKPNREDGEERLKEGRRPYVEWSLHEGENALSVRTRNEFGVLGKPASVRVVLEKRKPE